MQLFLEKYIMAISLKEKVFRDLFASLQSGDGPQKRAAWERSSYRCCTGGITFQKRVMDITHRMALRLSMDLVFSENSKLYSIIQSFLRILNPDYLGSSVLKLLKRWWCVIIWGKVLQLPYVWYFSIDPPHPDWIEVIFPNLFTSLLNHLVRKQGERKILIFVFL